MVTGVDAIGHALGKALKGRRCLVVVDDAWRAEDLRHFLQLTDARLLVTTRTRHLVEQAGQTHWSEVPVDEMAVDEAAPFLGEGFPSTTWAGKCSRC